MAREIHAGRSRGEERVCPDNFDFIAADKNPANPTIREKVAGDLLVVPKPKIKSWSVAAQKIADQAKDPKKLLPQQIIEQEIERAHDQAVADVYGADWKQHVDAQGRPQEQGIGSTLWLLRVSEEEAETHYAAISRWRGPAAAAAERERIARLKGAKK
jgi:hypothetical protein